MKRLNVHWLSSKKGCVSAKLSLVWMKKAFIPEVEAFCKRSIVGFNILLILDSATGHSPLLSSAHPDVNVQLLPPNTTSLLQPLDQEVFSIVKAPYSHRQFCLMCQATEDAALINRLVEEKEEKALGDTEAEQRVLRFWRGYNVKEAVDLLVSCWENVTPATVHHA